MIYNTKYIKDYLDSILVQNYTINYDLSVDVFEDVYITDYKECYIGIKFNIVNGDFNIMDSNIESLFGCPVKVKGSFTCRNTKISNLDYSPILVGGYYNVRNNLINDISNIAKEIGGFIDLDYNPINDITPLNMLNKSTSSIFVDVSKINDLYDVDVDILKRIKCDLDEESNMIRNVVCIKNRSNIIDNLLN